MEAREAQFRSDQSLDPPVIFLNEVVQVLGLARLGKAPKLAGLRPSAQSAAISRMPLFRTA
jgi:hypothetical protein